MGAQTEGGSELSAVEAAGHIRAGELSSEALVRACLARIEAREPLIGAWAHLDPDRALAQARARDAEPPRGPLHGVPVGIKDIFDTADLPTAYGSPIYAGHRPDRDAVCVQRLRDAGAVILGKTVTTEFALFHPGKTRNPHDPSRTPGGSSSGSAAAVADRMVPLALGTQTAGSVVRPACFCGIWGLKPTFGAIPTDGVKACAPSLDTVGAFARSVDDLTLALEVMAAAPIASAPLPERVAFVRTYEWDRAEPATQAAMADLAATVGASEVELPEAFAGLVAAQERLMAREAATALAVEHTDHRDACSPRLLALLDEGAQLTEADRRESLDAAAAGRAALADVFAVYDVLLAPAVLGEAPEGLDATGDPLFCRLWTLLGAPSVAVPGLRGPTGLPLGVQIIGPPGGDDRALAGARWLGEQIRAGVEQ
jgi:Asp-tRNA(Asn)/Glu-tRNA(Gln) amidotransferase A subunit family amidase